MSPEAKTYRAIFEGLVKDVGGVEPAAAILHARCGSSNKGTVSKMCNGHLAVSVEAMTALEDAARRFPCTDLLADRRDRVEADPKDIMQLAANAALEHGQAQEAIISSFSEKSSDPSKMTDRERSRSIKEARESLVAAEELVEALENGQRNG